ncbi:RNA polymerase sigma factor [Nocardia seriolae]|uniref:ECF RNA polymerase sigma factor SigM n=1 Tax=Nocardia seriolae TaxID=37332 RepID=A0A0B8NQA4_9NOCA|nr:ECF RNA polymerase sigma factor SigM [Nocardia seriolae]GEM27964.1 RNA polymerase sigma factor [Nocardia seriolae NBRC 15557]MTJ62627.1 sigma-70 family RNA polymerase sigma factor [Nocardia seriolae]MTJ75425.1 sigma-70 family RNA polymerase sigma factor [Nocardia seriolae]MTJ89333.1 sigma-70 family RNA polymerase sigma factor [Nocardia seriolae]
MVVTVRIDTKDHDVAGGWAGEQLVAAAQHGDREAIAAVVYGAHPHVRRFALHLCASETDAEDATQEALIILYRKIGTLRATTALASWMFRIVRNECLRRARHLIDPGPRAVGDGDPVLSAEDEVLRRLDADRLAQAITDLPEVQRRVLIMRDVLGYPGHATADSLGLSTAAMKSQLHRARAAVRADLGPRP